MRIALLHTALSHPTGGERQVLRLALELQELGHQVSLFTPFADRRFCFPSWLDRLHLIEVPPAGGAHTARWGARLEHCGLARGYERLGILSLGTALAAGRFDLINCHNPTTPWAAWLAAQRLHLPVVWMCNEPPYWHYLPAQRSRHGFPLEYLLYGGFDRLAVSAVDEIVVLSARFRDIVRRAYGRPATVIRSGVDADFFAGGRGDLFRATHGLSGVRLLVQVGAGAAAKTTPLALRALRRLAADTPDLHLAVAGHSNEDMLLPAVRAAGLAGRVHFFPHLDDAELRDLYAAADAVLFPFAQSWGLAATEAMAAARPVLVSAAAGVAEIIRDGTTGWVLPHDDETAWSARIAEVLAEPARARAVGAAAAALVREQLSWRRYTESMLDCFQRAANRRH